MIAVIIQIALTILVLAAAWKLFERAGEAGWASLVPIYNIIIWLKIAGKPWWWLLLMCIPLVGFVVAIIASIAFAERFGKSAGFGVGIALLGFIFLPILAFGDAEYTALDTTAP